MKKMLFFSFMIFATSAAYACTNVMVSASDGSNLVGRSMEFGQDLNSQIIVNPRGQKIESTAPDGQKGLSWTSKYGYIALNGLGMDFAVDGMNEKGFSYGTLWMPGSQYENISSSDANKTVSTTFIGSWLLGNFATVQEVKDALNSVKIWGEPIAGLNNSVPPIHVIIQDAAGKSGVIEFFKGETKFYDNPIGVLTNYPWFDWQLTNLQNFVNIKALNVAPELLGSVTLGGTGQGSGMLGIPGDWTPPSRFVRIALFQQFAEKPTTAGEGVNLLLHLLNTVDIPAGDVLEKGGSKPVFDYTQWIVVKDLTNKQFYYRTYQDLNVHQVDFNKLNLEVGAPELKSDLSLSPTYIDDTNKLKAK